MLWFPRSLHKSSASLFPFSALVRSFFLLSLVCINWLAVRFRCGSKIMEKTSQNDDAPNWNFTANKYYKQNGRNHTTNNVCNKRINHGEWRRSAMPTHERAQHRCICLLLDRFDFFFFVVVVFAFRSFACYCQPKLTYA